MLQELLDDRQAKGRGKPTRGRGELAANRHVRFARRQRRQTFRQ